MKLHDHPVTYTVGFIDEDFTWKKQKNSAFVLFTSKIRCFCHVYCSSVGLYVSKCACSV